MALRGQKLFRKGTPAIKILDLNVFDVKTLERGIVSDNRSSDAYYGPGESKSSDEKTKVTSGEQHHEQSIPEEPTNCCMSGCANCVWIKYAEELINSFDGGSDMAREIVMDKIQDPNMKAFLNMELRTMGK